AGEVAAEGRVALLGIALPAEVRLLQILELRVETAVEQSACTACAALLEILVLSRAFDVAEELAHARVDAHVVPLVRVDRRVEQLHVLGTQPAPELVALHLLGGEGLLHVLHDGDEDGPLDRWNGGRHAVLLFRWDRRYRWRP